MNKKILLMLFVISFALTLIPLSENVYAEIETYNITFQEVNEVEDINIFVYEGTDIEGSPDYEGLTDSNGIEEFDLPEGEYSIEFFNDAYKTKVWEGEDAIYVDSEETYQFEMEEIFNVTFNVTDQMGVGIEGIDVHLENEAENIFLHQETDENGIAIFETIEADGYEWAVEETFNGFFIKSDFGQLDLTEDVTIDVELYNIEFEEVNGLEEVEINFHLWDDVGEEPIEHIGYVETDENGTVGVLLSSDHYHYHASKDGYFSTDDDFFVDQDDTIYFEMEDGVEITFQEVNGLEGVNIGIHYWDEQEETVGDFVDNKYTDENGVVVFYLEPDEYYNIQYGKDGYIPKEEIRFIDDDETIYFEMQEVMDGEGTEAEPYIIENWYHLDYIRVDLDKYYALGNNINETSAGYEQLVEGGEWYPIGYHEEPFEGSLDGRDYEIADLHIEWDYIRAGLFGVIEDAHIYDIDIVGANITITQEQQQHGILGGTIQVGNEETLIDNVYVEGIVDGSDNNVGVGGMIGFIEYATINNSHATGYVEGEDNVGGLVGSQLDGTIENSYTTGEVIGYGHNTGGLIGEFKNGTIYNSHATGYVEGEEVGSNVGGLVGSQLDGIIENSYTTGEVIGYGHNTGGLVGRKVDGIIENSYSQSDVNGYTNVGGLIGEHLDGQIENSYTTGEVIGYGHNTGGLIGEFENGTIYNSHATGYVEGEDNTGGLIGEFENGTIYNSHATGYVEGEDNTGGLVGRKFDGIIENSYSQSDVNGYINVGGLVGRKVDGIIENSYSQSDVNGYSNVGGLVGSQLDGTIENSFSMGDVRGEGYNTGGLVGRKVDGIIENSYSQSDVNGYINVGGLIGEHLDGHIGNLYSTGNVRGDVVDGLVGVFENGTIENIHLNEDTSSYTDEVFGLSHNEMIGDQAETNMVLDFEETWTTTTEAEHGFDGFPILQDIDNELQRNEQRWFFIEDVEPEETTEFDYGTTEVELIMYPNIHNIEEDIDVEFAYWDTVEEDFVTMDEQVIVGEPINVNYMWTDLSAGTWYWSVSLYQEREFITQSYTDIQYFDIEGEPAPVIDIVEPENKTYRETHFPIDVPVFVEIYGQQDVEYNCSITDNGELLTEIERTTENNTYQNYSTTLTKNETDTHTLEAECYSVDATNTEAVTYSVDRTDTITGMIPVTPAIILGLLPLLLLFGGVLVTLRHVQEDTTEIEKVVKIGIFLVILAIFMRYMYTVIV